MAEVTISHLAKSYQLIDGGSLLVLDDLSFSIPDRSFACILGPSGCGKSILLNLFTGLQSPDQGSILFSGRVYDGNNVRISYVFQEPRLLNWRTAAENVEFALEGMKIRRGEWATRIERYLDLVSLTHFKDQFPLFLSGGMRQRVSIARALSIEPDILLMDEPFSNLDEITANEMRRDLLALMQKLRQTVFFVTHNAFEAAFLGDLIILLTARPARLIEVVVNPIPKPRDLDSREVFEFRREIVQRMRRPEAEGRG